MIKFMQYIKWEKNLLQFNLCQKFLDQSETKFLDKTNRISFKYQW